MMIVIHSDSLTTSIINIIIGTEEIIEYSAHHNLFLNPLIDNIKDTTTNMKNDKIS